MLLGQSGGRSIYQSILVPPLGKTNPLSPLLKDLPATRCLARQGVPACSRRKQNKTENPPYFFISLRENKTFL